MKEALNEVSAGELASLVARREVGARELVAHFQERIERLNPAINAVCTVNPNALAEGEACDRRLQSGERPRPLEGVPFVAKDNLDTKGLRTTFGSLLCANYVPEQDAIAVERLRAAGAVLIGKTNTPEFASHVNTTNRLFGPTRNPFDLNVTAGGSSGGTGAALAAGMAPIGLGTDLGGSIRVPSSFCGTIGIRPAPGRVPVYPTNSAGTRRLSTSTAPWRARSPMWGLCCPCLPAPTIATRARFQHKTTTTLRSHTAVRI